MSQHDTVDSESHANANLKKKNLQKTTKGHKKRKKARILGENATPNAYYLKPDITN